MAIRERGHFTAHTDEKSLVGHDLTFSVKCEACKRKTDIIEYIFRYVVTGLSSGIDERLDGQSLLNKTNKFRLECEICDCTPNERWTDAQDAALARARCVALKPQKYACGRPRFARGADKIYYVIFLEYVNYELVLE